MLRVKHRTFKPETTPRRSLRLVEALENSQQLPSPSSASSQSKKEQWPKRKRDSEELEEQTLQKKPRQLGSINPPQASEHDPVAYWATNSIWPRDFGKDHFIMSNDNGSKRTSASSNKRKSDSTHRFDRLERLAQNGIFMKNNALVLKSSKDLCKRFLQGNREPEWWSYPPEQLPTILERIEELNEARIKRDILPWVVPSAENLFYSGDLAEDWIGDEIQTDWIHCETMGSTRPKPDYTAGLLRKAFTKDEVERLRNYSSPARPFLFTPELSFPFLICEVKSGQEGLNNAHHQNIHSASIAVRAIIELYKAAFSQSAPERVEELYGQILVFTVSHNHNLAHLYGHYAILAEGSTDKLAFYSYEIEVFSFTRNEGRDRFSTYNFVYNVYGMFAKEHRERIKEAAAHLRSPQTGLSFSTSELELQEGGSQSNSQEDETFQRPGEPASALQKKQMTNILNHTQRANEKLQSQVDELLRQQEQQRQLLERMEQERKEEREEMMALLKKP